MEEGRVKVPTDVDGCGWDAATANANVKRGSEGKCRTDDATPRPAIVVFQ
jgi:hypothetical protein